MQRAKIHPGVAVHDDVAKADGQLQCGRQLGGDHGVLCQPRDGLRRRPRGRTDSGSFATNGCHRVLGASALVGDYVTRRRSASSPNHFAPPRATRPIRALSLVQGKLLDENHIAVSSSVDRWKQPRMRPFSAAWAKVAGAWRYPARGARRRCAEDDAGAGPPRAGPRWALGENEDNPGPSTDGGWASKAAPKGNGPARAERGRW
jgi:hypothetical protein